MSESHRGVLFIGGAGPAPEILDELIHSDDIICAADSGLDAALGAGVRPHGVVGDMDSISDRRLLEDFPEDSVREYPRDKDETDAELGLAWLRERGCRPIVLIGGGEGRLDHSLALLGLFDGEQAPSLWYTALEEIRCIDGSWTMDAPRTVSFFPVGPGPWSVVSRGLRWELDGLDWARGDASLSNRVVGSSARVDVRRGRLLAIRPIR